MSFGVRGGKYVVGMVTNEEVLDESNPFQDLISGAGWLVRSGVNHVDASARDGHLDYLRDIGTGSGDGGRDHGEAPGEGLDDVLTAKLARTALGYDAEGRLILLQVGLLGWNSVTAKKGAGTGLEMPREILGCVAFETGMFIHGIMTH